MSSGPPPLPPMPPPLPVGHHAPPPVQVGYRTARADGSSWVTVASIRSPAKVHAAIRLLSGQNILSRIGPDEGNSDDMNLQVLSTEAEWARDILARGIPELIGMAQPPGGFPVITVPITPGSPGVSPAAALPVMPVEKRPTAAPFGAGYYLILAVLWVLLALIVLSIVWAWRTYVSM